MGRKLDDDDFVLAGDYPLWYSFEGADDLGDIAQPATEVELNEIRWRLIARLRALAWEGDRLRTLGTWIDENVNEGVQVCDALRMLLKYSKDKGQSQHGSHLENGVGSGRISAGVGARSRPNKLGMEQSRDATVQALRAAINLRRPWELSPGLRTARGKREASGNTVRHGLDSLAVRWAILHCTAIETALKGR